MACKYIYINISNLLQRQQFSHLFFCFPILFYFFKFFIDRYKLQKINGFFFSFFLFNDDLLKSLAYNCTSNYSHTIKSFTFNFNCLLLPLLPLLPLLLLLLPLLILMLMPLSMFCCDAEKPQKLKDDDDNIIKKKV